MNGAVNNGSRPRVELGDFSGRVGLIVKDDVTKLAYTPNKKGVAPASGGVIEVGGKSFHVLARDASKYVPNMVVLTLEPVNVEPKEGA